MQELSQQSCQACRADSQPLLASQQQPLLMAIPQWHIELIDGIEQLKRVFKFTNFVTAIQFSNKLAALAEQHGHHPAILVEWGQVTVFWWSHKIKGLHENDFVMAAKTDHLYD